jgi:putative ABC transport system permease protein
MKFVRLLFKNLFRNKRRTFLTVSSIAVSLFLVATLQTLLYELQNPPETPDSALRLIVRHRISLFNALPSSHRQKIASIDGVEAVIGSFWYGGIYKEPSNFFANFSVDADQFFEIYPDYEISEEEKQAFISDRTGAIVGRSLVDRFGWQVGDVLYLDSQTWPIEVELTIRGIYDGGTDLGTTLYFHWDYYNELMKKEFGQWDNTGTYAVRVESPEDVTRVSNEIDAMFKNSSFPTKTESEKAFLLSFVSVLGDVQLFITSIVTVVVFTILLVAANTMAMSIRERVREIGILKALGFKTFHVLLLLISESVVLSIAGAVIGAVGARIIFSALPMAKITSGFIQRFYVAPGIILLCIVIGLLIGLLAAGFPAFRASRRSVVDALRRIA